MPITQADMSEQEELESVHQLNKARDNRRRRVKKIRGELTDLYWAVRPQSPAVWDMQCLHGISCVLV